MAPPSTSCLDYSIKRAKDPMQRIVTLASAVTSYPIDLLISWAICRCSRKLGNNWPASWSTGPLGSSGLASEKLHGRLMVLHLFLHVLPVELFSRELRQLLEHGLVLLIQL